MFRTAFALTFTVLWCVAWISFIILVLFFYWSPDFSCYWAREWWGPGLFWGGGQKFVVEGQENCPQGACVYLSNHQGIPDVPMIFVGIPRGLRFVAAKGIRYIPILGWYMLLDKHVFIDRTNRTQAIFSLQAAGERIRRGINVVMFPEGTRTRDGAIHSFKKGPFRLALEAQVPIVPMALEGARNCWPKGKLWITPGTLRLKIGQPIPTAGLTKADRDDLMRRVRHAIIGLHREIGGVGGDLEDNIAPELRNGGKGDGVPLESA